MNYYMPALRNIIVAKTLVYDAEKTVNKMLLMKEGVGLSVFVIFLLIGLFFPLITLLLSGLFSGISEIAHELHVDIGSLGDSVDLPGGDPSDIADIGSNSEGSFWFFSFFPMSPLMWSVALAVTGCVGEILRITVGFPLWLLFLVAVPCGYFVMFAIFNFIFRPLQRVDNSVKSESDLAYSTATVMEAIPAGGYGSVRFEGSVGTVTYAAYEIDGVAVPQGTAVWVVRIVDGRAEVQHDSSGKLNEIVN